jgi:hypothetical protein
MGHDGCRCYSANRSGPRRFITVAPAIAVTHGGGKLVLLNFEMVVYFSKMKK